VISVPPIVRNKAVAAGGQWWLDGLEPLIADLEAEWEITVGAPFTDGTEAYVARAETAAGEPAVLKLLIPRAGNAAHNEITVLRLAAGEGCPRMFSHDLDRSAILMERLGPSLHDLGLPVAGRHDILCDTAARIWRPAPACGLPTGADKGRWLIDHITALWDELDRPCSSAAVDHAIACAERRIAAHDPERAVLVHGDVHEWNTLRSSDDYKLVDPDGLLAEPEYDLGIIMREDPLELMEDPEPTTRARMLAQRTGLDQTAIWEWGVVERLSTGLLATKIDLQPVGHQMLGAAERLV